MVGKGGGDGVRRPPRAKSPSELGMVETVLLPVVVAAGGVFAGAIGGDYLEVEMMRMLLGHDGHDYDLQRKEEFLFFEIGLAIICYCIFTLGSRCFTVGVYYMCEVLWGCNTALLLAGFGMCTGRPLLVGTATCIVALDQISWYFDCLGYLFTGKFHVGVSKYLIAPTTSRIHFITAFHHLWFLPVCLYTLKEIGMPPMSYIFSVVLTSALALAARFLTPYAVNEEKQVKVFNINLSYGFWDDINVPFVHSYDHHHPTIYLPYLIVVCNLYLNTLPVIGLYFATNYLKSVYV
mmetsp:Transcript_14646/g.25742  ORF Transcript_14646/g.25742 Transcript_14646/m.25742 type:complete len:292 (+) Transcript_14646:276-1151(+)